MEEEAETDHAAEIAVALRTVPVAGFSLLLALLFGLIKRGILTPEDGRNILENALKNAESYIDTFQNEAVRVALQASVSEELSRFLDHPLIKDERTT